MFSAPLTSVATSAASRRGGRAGIDPAMRSVIQRKSAPWAASIKAGMRKVPARCASKFRSHCSLDISRLVAGPPHSQDHVGIGGLRFDPSCATVSTSVSTLRTVTNVWSFHTLLSSDSRLKTMPVFADEECVQQFELIEGQPHIAASQPGHRLRAGST